MSIAPGKDLTGEEIELFEEYAQKEGVSKRARSEGQIVDQFKMYGRVDQLPEHWQEKRKGFIARHGVSYQNHPTYRRYLALIMWGYLPNEMPPKIPGEVEELVDENIG